VIDHARIVETTDAALEDLNFVFATTARNRDLTKDVFTPEEAMAQARSVIGQGGRVGVLFGPERAGLENEDIVRANALISVPVNPAFASLNLAQCVLLVAYEWRRQGEEGTISDDAQRATGIEMQKLREHLEERLEATGFFWPDDKRDSMISNLRNMLSRMPLTDADVRIMHGIIRALADKSPR
jgi:tRNA/rRNA methyltransferase